jgi:hypothetical protein
LFFDNFAGTIRDKESQFFMQKNQMSGHFVACLSLMPLGFAFFCAWGALSFIGASFPQALALGVMIALVGKLVVFFKMIGKLRS